ncbi:MAG: DUF4190 domain-containing protein [Streptosporangiaceae bacterium]
MTSGSQDEIRAAGAGRETGPAIAQAEPPEGQQADPRQADREQADREQADREQAGREQSGPAQPPGSHPLAAASLIFGISQVLLPVIGGILAIAAGYLALRQSRRSGQTGRGMAVVGLILGYIGVVVPIVLVASMLVAG